MSLSLDISPARLFLSLGVVQHSYDTELHQFLGKVTNIRVYRGLAQGEGEMEEMTRSPCPPSSLQTILLWEEMQWKITGEFEQETIPDTIFCSESQHHPVLQPTSMSRCQGHLLHRFIWTPYT